MSVVEQFGSTAATGSIPTAYIAPPPQRKNGLEDCHVLQVCQSSRKPHFKSRSDNTSLQLLPPAGPHPAYLPRCVVICPTHPLSLSFSTTHGRPALCAPRGPSGSRSSPLKRWSVPYHTPYTFSVDRT